MTPRSESHYHHHEQEQEHHQQQQPDLEMHSDESQQTATTTTSATIDAAETPSAMQPCQQDHCLPPPQPPPPSPPHYPSYVPTSCCPSSGPPHRPRPLSPGSTADELSCLSHFTIEETYHQMEENLYCSFLSDWFFLAGGMGYLILSVWDILIYNNDPADFAQGFEGIESRNYYTLDFWAPFVYLINGCIDIEWAARLKRRSKDGWMTYVDDFNCYEPHPEDYFPADNPNISASLSPLSVFSSKFATTPPSSKLDKLNSKKRRYFFQKMKRLQAHRRTILASILAAATFGIAALFAVVAVVFGVYMDRTDWAAYCDSASVHVYVFSALISVTAKRTRPWVLPTLDSFTDANRLMDTVCNDLEVLRDLGDFLFLVGSVIDMLLEDMEWGTGRPIGPLISSFLWALDACFYLRTDFIMMYRLRQEDDEDDDDNENNTTTLQEEHCF